MTQSLPKKASRLEFNQFLEKWYNQGIEDRVVLVPLFFWSKKVAGVHPKSVPEERVTGPILPEIEKKVITFLSQLSHRPISTITKDQELSQHLGLDSLDLVQIYLFLDEKFNIANLASGSLVTVGDVMQGAGGYLEGTKRQRSEESPFSWREEKRKTSGIPEGAKTIIEAFLLQVDRMGNLSCCADDSFGLMSYSKMKKRALILASQFRKFPEKRVGVMLPSSTAAYLVILALMLANKVPVMLNWTVGTKALDHAIDLLEIKRAITSIRFLDKIELESLGKVEERFYFLEEIRENISLKEVVLSLIDSWKSAKGLIKIFSLDTIGSSDPALFLFTSGTEALPKAVPLSHENILSNQRAALSALSFCASDIFYGVLPPFHSFGFSATGLFPILSGIRVAYAPDPTDSHKMARDIARYKATLFCAAPSFITALFHAAKKEDLVSLRLILSGAEKTPQALFDYVRAHLPNAKLLEGYGITECSPVVTVDREDEPHRGVGKPLPGLEIAIIDPDTQERLLPGKEGVICILGPSVFSGYYGMRVQPFITIGNRSFFQSGDRGFLDERGTLILTGRSKRFVKIGGEMIGLSGIEEELLNAFSVEVAKKEGPSIVIGMKEGEMGKPELVLFTTLSLDRDEVNETLKRSGFGRLVKISTVYHKESLPVLGTGKVNYRALLEGLDS